MELQCLGAGRVAAINAAASVRCDEIGLPLTAPLSERATELLASAFATGTDGVLCGPEAERNLRCVVIAERRTLQTELAPIKRAHLSVDDHLCRKLSAACDTKE